MRQFEYKNLLCIAISEKKKWYDRYVFLIALIASPST